MDLSILLGFGSIVLAAVADIVLVMMWNRAYFTIGVPVFVRRVERPGGIAGLPLTELEARAVTAAGPPLLFRRLDSDVIAFRERVFGGLLHYTPVMHGVIRYDPTEGVARVTGILNWFVIAFVTVFVPLLGWAFVEILPVLGLFGLIYFIQAVRFSRVARTLRHDGLPVASGDPTRIAPR